MITAQEKYLTFRGYESDALRLVEDIRSAFDASGNDMPKVLNDFVFNIEVALQNAGILDDDFNEVDRTHGSPWDRGSADSYYRRAKNPHWYPEGTYHGTKVTDLTEEEVKEYMLGYDENNDFKDWG